MPFSPPLGSFLHPGPIAVDTTSVLHGSPALRQPIPTAVSPHPAQVCRLPQHSPPYSAWTLIPETSALTLTWNPFSPHSGSDTLSRVTLLCESSPHPAWALSLHAVLPSCGQPLKLTPAWTPSSLCLGSDTSPQGCPGHCVSPLHQPPLCHTDALFTSQALVSRPGCL